MNANLVYSRVFGNVFDIRKCVRVINPSQMAFYLKGDIVPKDIYVSKNFTTGKDIIVMVFDRDETAQLYKAWESQKESGAQL